MRRDETLMKETFIQHLGAEPTKDFVTPIQRKTVEDLKEESA